MTIQFNTDHNIHGTEKFRDPLIAYIAAELADYNDQIMRIEVHLSDENANKGGPNDKLCMLEARLKGMEPIAVKNEANTSELAVEGAVEKLKNSLETIIGHLRNAKESADEVIRQNN